MKKEPLIKKVGAQTLMWDKLSHKWIPLDQMVEITKARVEKLRENGIHEGTD